MTNERRAYLIDADVLIVIRDRNDSGKIYDELIHMAHRGRLKTVRQTFDEIKNYDPPFAILKDHREKFQITAEQQFDPRVSAYIDWLGDNALQLWEQTGGKNPDPADPWIVAVGATYGYTVVTNESPRSPVKIPAACRMPHINCRCIRGPHFLLEVGIVTQAQIKPEFIDPAAFFQKGEG